MRPPKTMGCPLEVSSSKIVGNAKIILLCRDTNKEGRHKEYSRQGNKQLFRSAKSHSFGRIGAQYTEKGSNLRITSSIKNRKNANDHQSYDEYYTHNPSCTANMGEGLGSYQYRAGKNKIPTKQPKVSSQSSSIRQNHKA